MRAFFTKNLRSYLNNWNGIVSLFIACVELIILINLLIFAEKNKVNKPVFILIGLLMGYQILEWLMCGLNLRYSSLAFLAFVDISFLPPLNLYFLLLYLGKSNKKIILIFLPAIFFLFYYLFTIPQFQIVHCTVFYAVYNYPLGDLYGFFYYLPLIVSIIIIITKLKTGVTKSIKTNLTAVLSGLIFISLPVIAAFLLKFAGADTMLKSVESIMCKFAFVYAVFLSFFCINNKKVNE